VSKTYELADLKAKSQKHGVSFNNYSLAVMNMAMHRYSEGKEPNPVFFGVAMSLDEPVKSLRDFLPNNNASVLQCKMNLHDNLLDATNEVNK
jgi:hypothetical protein